MIIDLLAQINYTETTNFSHMKLILCITDFLNDSPKKEASEAKAIVGTLSIADN